MRIYTKILPKKLLISIGIFPNKKTYSSLGHDVTLQWGKLSQMVTYHYTVYCIGFSVKFKD